MNKNNPLKILWYSQDNNREHDWTFSMITQFLPSLEKFQETEQQYIEYFTAKGEKDILGRVISNIRGNIELQASQGVDGWLSYGVYLPSIEYIIAIHQGESEDAFYERTQYPREIVTAYTIPQHPIATLIAADKYSRIHQQNTAPNTTIWALNDSGRTLDLNDYPNRLKARI